MTSAAERVNERRTPVTGSGTAAPITVVGRQAIHNANGRVVAHELLFRTLGADSADVTDGDAATAEVLVSAFTDIGFDELVGDARAFVNVPRRFLVDGMCHILPRDRVVLELLEDIPADDEVLAAVTSLVDTGYTIALDDFEFRADLAPLVDLAHIIKVDVLALSPGELADSLDRLDHRRRPDGRRHLLLAEKVEDRDQLPALAAAGFELFQGFALSRPETVHGGQRTLMLQVLTELHRPDLDITDVVETLSHDPSLAYAILRITNSAAISPSTRISSIRHAAVMLGIEALRNWATLLLMTRVAGGSPEAVAPALVRAKLCERLSDGWGLNGSVGFTVGMLSSLPSVLGEPLEPIVARLALEPDAEQALLERSGPFGKMLSCVEAYERADQEALAALDAPPWLADAALAGLAWARQVTTLTAGQPTTT